MEKDWADLIALELCPDRKHTQIFIAVELRKAKYDGALEMKKRALNCTDGFQMIWQDAHLITDAISALTPSP